MNKNLMWLSFCDPDKPEGTQFIGACIVECSAPDDIAGAVRSAWAHGCNPGGEAMGYPIPSERSHEVPKHLRNRLMGKQEWTDAGFV